MNIVLLAFLLAAETGSVSGRVTDFTGGVLRDCLVTIKSETGFLSRQQRTGPGGGYNLAALPVGRYRVSFAVSGFRESVLEHVAVETGSHVRLDVTLAREPLEPLQVEIEVPAVAPMDRERTAPAVTLDRSFLEGVPSGRSPWSVLELTPGLVSDRFDVGGSASPQQSLVSAAGTSYSQNEYRVNGVDVTDPAALGASATYYSFDSFEEIQVSTWGSEAEVQSPGVLVNIVLKSGGNRLAGGAALYFENDALQSDNLDDHLRAQGVPPSYPLDSYLDLSAEVGGPIVRDRASFYASYGRERIDRFALGFFRPGGEPGVDSTELSNVVARTTLGLAPRQSLSLLFFRNDKLRPYRDAGRFRPTPETTLHQDSRTGVFQAHYSTTLGERALLDARFDVVDLDFPLGEQSDRPSNAYSRLELANGVRNGGPGSDVLFTRDRFQGNASFFLFVDEWLGGSHDWKIGWESGVQSASAFYDLAGAVLYRDFFGAPLQVELYSEPLTTENLSSNLGLFAQDSYVRGPLVLNLGARFDRWKNGYPDQSRTAGRWDDFFRARGLRDSVPGVEDVVSFTSLAPRIGFTYSLTSDGRTLVRGSYGRFYHQMGTDFVSSVNPNGRAAAVFRFDDINRNRVVDSGEIDLDRPLGVGLPALNEIEGSLERPRTDALTIGVERELA
ncbi:MAG: carboxypeptidase regulatory-like domain-containing protein, partial [Vicinamibacteria bacterium]